MIQLNDLKVDWITLVPSTIGGQWGGWLSKNYASLTRVALWIFALLLEIEHQETWVDPKGNPKKWTVKNYRGWLRVRGMDSKGKKEELQKRVLI